MSETAQAWSGSVAAEPFPAILRRIFAERRTGRLTFVRESETIRLFFDHGELRTATSSIEGRRIGDVLLRRGLVSEAGFRAALASDGDRRSRLGKLLVERGLIAQNVLDAEMRRLAEEIVFAAFTWRDGEFRFEDDEGSPNADVWLDHSTAALIVEGIRRLPESDEDLEKLGDLGRKPAAIEDPASRWGFVKLAPQEGYLFSLCNGKTSFRDVLKLAPSRAAGAKILHALLACGLIEVSEAPVAAEVPEPGAPAAASARPAPLTRDIPIESAEPDAEARFLVARGSYLRARQLMESRDFFGAIVLLEQCVKLVPDNSEYHYRLASALSRNPRWGERTILQFHRALSLGPNRTDALREFAEFLLARKRPAEAREPAAHLFELSPEDPKHVDLLRRCEAAMGIAPPPAPAEESGEEEARPKSLLGRLFRRNTE
jgi:tetratricopeptide (TPR) repeat protein